MEIMKEQLITFETAKLAKEKGFPIKLPNHEGHILEGNKPTQSLLQKWLREKHNINVFICYSNQDQPNYSCFIITKNEENHFMDITPGIQEDIYEETLEQGLQESLKIIKKK